MTCHSCDSLHLSGSFLMHAQVFNVGYSAKRRGMSASEMASAVDEGLKRHGWFVTGRVDASLFSDSFFFSDPQVDRPPLQQFIFFQSCGNVREAPL